MNPTYIHALLWGVLIGISALLLSGGLGRVMGISGIITAILPKSEKDIWRYAFILSIPLGVGLYAWFDPTFEITTPSNSYPLAIIAGILVGVGTYLGNGCTSGHAVCGLGRLSLRSLVATITFITTGVITVFISKLF